MNFASARRENFSPHALAGGGGSVWAGWYPLTPAPSLVGRRAQEYRAPQVTLHMACSLLRRIKCQLWNHLKDQRSVFLIRPEFWESSSFYCAPKFFFFFLHCMFEIMYKMSHHFLDMGMSLFSHKKLQNLKNKSPHYMHYICLLLTIVPLSCVIYRHNSKVRFWSFLWPPPRETHRPQASAANGTLFWAPTKLFSPSSILQEELPDT